MCVLALLRYTTVSRLSGIMLGAVLCLLLALPAPTRADTPALRESSAKTYDDVLADLELAAIEHNFSIITRSNIGDGIRKRDAPGFPRSVVVQLCNLTLAQEALEIDPDYILHMPCRVAVQERGDRVFVLATPLPEDGPNPRQAEFSRKLNAILKEIVHFAAQ